VGGQIRPQRRHRWLERRVDAADHDAPHVLAAREQPLRGDEGRGRLHARVRTHLRQYRVGVRQRVARGGQHLHVRQHPQHAVAHLFLKAVHHRQHDDERSHPQRDAQHGDGTDESDETIAAGSAAGARVAPADHPFVR